MLPLAPASSIPQHRCRTSKKHLPTPPWIVALVGAIELFSRGSTHARRRERERGKVVWWWWERGRRRRWRLWRGENGAREPRSLTHARTLGLVLRNSGRISDLIAICSWAVHLLPGSGHIWTFSSWAQNSSSSFLRRSPLIHRRPSPHRHRIEPPRADRRAPDEARGGCGRVRASRAAASGLLGRRPLRLLLPFGRRRRRYVVR
jgi:hypothetical protein